VFEKTVHIIFTRRKTKIVMYLNIGSN